MIQGVFRRAYTSGESTWPPGGVMFDQISEPRTTKRKRQEILLGIAYFGLGILYLAKACYTWEPWDFFLGSVWLFGGLVWALRSRTIDDDPTTQLRINHQAENDYN
jgi:hypothetical protein